MHVPSASTANPYDQPYTAGEPLFTSRYYRVYYLGGRTSSSFGMRRDRDRAIAFRTRSTYQLPSRTAKIKVLSFRTRMDCPLYRASPRIARTETDRRRQWNHGHSQQWSRRKCHLTPQLVRDDIATWGRWGVSISRRICRETPRPLRYTCECWQKLVARHPIVVDVLVVAVSRHIKFDMR